MSEQLEPIAPVEAKEEKPKQHCKLQGKGPHWLCRCDTHPYPHCRFCSKPVEVEAKEKEQCTFCDLEICKRKGYEQSPRDLAVWVHKDSGLECCEGKGFYAHAWPWLNPYPNPRWAKPAEPKPTPSTPEECGNVLPHCDGSPAAICMLTKGHQGLHGEGDNFRFIYSEPSTPPERMKHYRNGYEQGRFDEKADSLLGEGPYKTTARQPDSSSIPDEPGCQCAPGKVDPKCPFYHPSSFDWEQEIKDISIAIIEGREILDVYKNVVIRNLVWAINNRTKPQTELVGSSSISSEPEQVVRDIDIQSAIDCGATFWCEEMAIELQQWRKWAAAKGSR